ncbi:LysR family transcriptional regulator [Eremococcus coleocola]|uniref:LysR substrate binding domain protein n=1 Tax=Eremococcus coleocola ACS-139-V-Col8 TaxID=908337 RepID=E4KQS9_9LACT|nr:LysR family transcriptional regulator [Eremococcus coleocola]EFR30589.1 LysR substrate binding domain protein [Eremococcus coleocola ACS-139-V-Col8]
MNFNHLEYFVNIVDCQFNLSITANKLHISQPTLSKTIKQFEESENIEVFYKKGGRNVGLTPAGQILYERAKQIIQIHDTLLEELSNLSRYPSGKIRIGIPPLVLSVLFTTVISKLISSNPNIKFEIIEAGAFDLVNKIEKGGVDIAIILQPNRINHKYFYEVTLFEDILSVYVNKNHELAQSIHRPIQWKELDNLDIISFDQTFMIRRLLDNKLKEEIVHPNFINQSISWDFLVETVKTADCLTILPRTIERFMNTNDLIRINFADPLPWNVAMVFPKKSPYSLLEKYTIQSLQNFFFASNNIFPIETYRLIDYQNMPIILKNINKYK